MAEHDLVIRGGMVVDGNGGQPAAGDVAISDGVITQVGVVDGSGTREVDADGSIVTPGFVDIHSHYDGQATWDNRMIPSAWHGVTTVVMGNCGVGFAPCKPQDRQRLIELMEGVEDIPGSALHEGLPWTWESFPEYLDHLATRRFDIDIAAQVPHGAVRLFVMGERGAQREAATPDEIVEMGRITREGVAAGALGFTTSRTMNHKTSKGEPTPTLTAAEDELVGIAIEMSGAGGVLEVVSDFRDLALEFGTMRKMVEASGRPLSISVAAEDHRAFWGDLVKHIHEAAADGLPIRGQVAARAIGVLLGLQATLNPFGGHAAYRDIAKLPLDERVRTIRDPSFRQRLLDEHRAAPNSFIGRFDRMFQLGDPPNYEPDPSTSVAARAERDGIDPAELAYDLLLGNDGKEFIYFPLFNWIDGKLDAIGQMLGDDLLLPGLADGGAHVGTICDASFPSTLLTHWARDRATGRLPLEWVVRRQCRDTAAAVGLTDRGVIAPGMKADVNVIDFDNLTIRPPEMHFDLPAGGKRLLQRAEGYLHTFVNGVETYANGTPTDDLPGRLVRGAR